MIRLPVAAFIALGVATIGAFFLTQHLKVSTPLINGYPAPVPSAINPVSGRTCLVRNPKGRRVPVSFRRMRISFYLQSRGDNVIVAIIDPASGAVVDTLPGSGRYLGTVKRRQYVWDGRESDGQVAPDGVYDIRVTLVHQGRSLLIANSAGTVEPVTVQTHPPRLKITAISPAVVADAGHSTVTIHYTGNQGLRPHILVFRPGSARALKNYAATSRAGTSAWNGTLAGGRPAPAGTYEVGLELAPDKTCNTVRSALRTVAVR